MNQNIIWSDEKAPYYKGTCIFLAGPSPRGLLGVNYNWREEALEIFAKSELSKQITLFVPLPFCGIVEDYDNQVEWEEFHLERADIIMFWIPRDLTFLPGFTTNFEFGEYYKSGKVVYGRPDDALKMRYLDYKFLKHNPDEKIYTTLEDTIAETLKRVKIK